MVILPSFYDFREIAFIRVIVLPECIYIGIFNYHTDIDNVKNPVLYNIEDKDITLSPLEKDICT